jgi:hypothetical protein
MAGGGIGGKFGCRPGHRPGRPVRGRPKAGSKNRFAVAAQTGSAGSMPSILPWRWRGLIVIAVGLACTAGAVPLDYYLPAGTSYDAAVPSPENFFGFQIGEWHLRSERVAEYCRAIAAAAPSRVKLNVIGYTYEHKPLVVLTVSSPENLARLDELRAQHLALFDPEKAKNLDLSTMPVVVDLGYSVHGNEASGVNAMPLVLYHLAAAQGPEVESMLRQTIIVIEAQRNPDGGDRFAQWVNSNRSANLSADPNSREHNESWPNGRTNHYWFDPNRDSWPLVHPEAQARAELFYAWRPNILTDHHEMGTNGTFFFQPGVPARNNPNTPAKIHELTAKIAAFNERALNGKGVFYYSEQGYDDFYPGKGSTYPDLNGTVGILFEQASARGHLQESENGLLTFPFAIRNHVLSSFSTLAAAQALRVELLSAQRDFVPQTLELARKSKVKAWVFSDDGDPARAAAFLELLARHRIEARPLKEEAKADNRTFVPGHAWLVVAEQPQYRLAAEAFGRRTDYADAVFYDVSAWNLPMGYGLPFAELATTPSTGAVVGVPPFPAGKRVGGRSDYAYLFNWSDYFAPRALHRLQKAGVLTKVLTSPIEAIGADGSRTEFSFGAILIPVGLQPEKSKVIDELIDTMVREDGVTVTAANSGLTPRGVDFGSASFVTLAEPRVALLTGEGVDANEIGEDWHLLDTRVGLAATLLDLTIFNRADLSRYNVIVMADGTYDSISDEAVASLRRWIRAGGTLVTTGRAVEWVAKKELMTIEFEKAADGPHTPRAGEAPPPPTAVKGRLPYEVKNDVEALKLIAGAIFETTVDHTHPLGYGYAPGKKLPLFRMGTLFMKPAKSPYETPVVYTEKPLLTGYVSEQNLKAVAESAAAIAHPVGAGVIVAMPDSPNFRGTWYGGNKLFLNAIFFGKTIRPARAGEE